ncbi:DUF11 domain-containing protein [Nereida sp. MMG025]|uniref:DUF11 domain-containing protein n=1 Tax=Nereida sp. MMG025 TaxID=2909981 RepID=UPI001F4290B4|nr:DUF11 domain-containing protein [Nereida sp. MMG025]MCF6443304.1 DUF11 domain-containing protein [Nereida sp. MMG025]
MIEAVARLARLCVLTICTVVFGLISSPAFATQFTMTVPGAGIPVPSQYPQAGGVVIVMVGVNGQVYYQFSDPDGAFRGYNSNGQPPQFRGNPFTINDPIPLNCGIRSCTDYFGGAIANVYIRFSAYDGDTQPNGFDEDDISLLINGFNVGGWSGFQTEKTNNSGTVSQGFQTGFGNNSFNTGWFSSSNPALMQNLLTTGQTTTQVLDDDPNDNYWDFRRGNSLQSEELRTIAPGYEFSKTADRTDFLSVGETINYTYTVTNIGSVDISNVSVFDDKVDAQGGTVTCDTTFLQQTTNGGAEQVATCTASYVVTQEDVDAGEVTNVARATGTPAFGSLGAVEKDVTVTGPAFDPDMDVTKTASPQTFSAVGETITYTFTLENTGNTTLTDARITDDKIPTLSCSQAALLPDDVLTCTGTYQVTQDDVDAFALSGTALTNTAEATAKDRGGDALDRSVQETITGPAAAPDLVVAKSALQQNYDSVGDVIQFRIEVTNTGNVTWPAPPAITDALITDAGGSVSCPAGAVAPNTSVTCTADYTVDLPDLNAGAVLNEATATITVGGQTATGDADVTVPAVKTTGLEIVKQLNSASLTEFSAVGDILKYDYVLTNTGNVTLSTAAVNDDKVAVTCPATDILPGDSLTCTSADYVVAQPDLDAGLVTNTASASANDPQGVGVDSDTVDLTVNANQMPSLGLVKSAPVVPAVDFEAGLEVTYTFTVTNDGNVTITDPITVSDDKFATAIPCGTDPLGVGESRVCQGIYTVTAADEDFGFVTNTATASDGTTVSNEDTATIPQAGTDAIELTKTPDLSSVSALTDVITYTFRVTNVGDRSIGTERTITIDDPKIANVACVQTDRIYPVSDGRTPTFIECTGNYSPTQAELDAGVVDNTATASFSRVNGGNPFTVTSPEASASVPVDITPAFSLDKQAPADFGGVGSTVLYTFDLTNDTAQTIAAANITDPKIPNLACSFTDIAPFATETCTGEYTVTQADVDAGSLSNTATATGTSATGAVIPPSTDTETISIDPAAAVKSMSLSKTSDVQTFSAVGDIINYTFAVANTGTQTLTGIEVTDTDLGFTCSIPTLAPQTVDDTTCRASYTIQQKDLDAGEYFNDATATAPDTPDADSSNTVDAIDLEPALVITKTPNQTANVAVGDTITYTYIVENTGNVTLAPVTLDDQHSSASGTAALTLSNGGTVASLAPDETASFTATYVVGQNDIDAGDALTNTVTATAVPPAALGLPDVEETADATVSLETPAAAMSVAKTQAAPATGAFGVVGSTVSYNFAITNDGNVTLSNVALTDDLVNFSCSVAPIAPLTTVTNCANGDPLTVSRVVTQADVDAGFITNTVDVAATAPNGDPVDATDELTLSGPVQAPSIDMVKTATSGADFTAVGDEIEYLYTIENTGNITLTGNFSVDDDKVAVTCDATPVGGVAPTQTLACSATYEVTQDDLDRGFVTNLATASIQQAVIPENLNDPSVQLVESPERSETVNAAQGPSLAIDKVVKPNTPATYAAPGDTVTFVYTVTNDGNVTLTDPITISDDKIAGGVAQPCSNVDLAPGDSLSCELVWTAQQIDIDSDPAEVTNTASPVTTFNGTPVPAGSDTATVRAVLTPELSVEKRFDELEDGLFQAGKTVSYIFEVENTGNTTITTQPVINDTIITTPIALVGTFPAGGLAPGGTLTYEGDYVLTLDDIRLGSVTNTATASTPEITSPPSSVTTPTDVVEPALSLLKEADVASFDAVGQIITYTYTVTNNSTGATRPAFANAITVTDDKITGPITCDPTADGQLVVGESTTCTAPYTVTQEDLDAVASGVPTGFVTNTATAETLFNTTTVLSNAATVTVPSVPQNILTMAKAVVAGPSPAAVDDVLTFGITTTNDGNQTLSGVLVSDPLIPALTCYLGADATGAPAPANVVLAPGDQLYCEGDYTVTQANIDDQLLENQATATGSTPQGTPVEGQGGTTHLVDDPRPLVEVEKALSEGEPATAFSAVGEEIEYTVTVRNSGNVTLLSTVVTDDLVPGESCTVGPLAPGEEDDSCVFVYTVTQNDIDAGEIINLARAASVPANDPTDEVTGQDSLTGNGPPPEPAFSLTKDADLQVFDAADTLITYTYRVSNTGNITLRAPVTVADDKIPNVTCQAFPPQGLLPLESITCTAQYRTTQDDVDDGGITNVASVSSLEVPFDPTNPDRAEATETVPSDRTAAFTIEKTADRTADVAAGETITYSYLVRNTGNVTLDDIQLSDSHTSAAGTNALSLSSGGLIATLAPDATATLTATYVVTQEDIDAGIALTNTVTGTAVPPTDVTPPDATDDLSVDLEAADPSLEVLKTITSTTSLEEGGVVTFEITVENTGNVTLDNVALTDTLRDANGTEITPAPTPVLASGDGVELDVDEVWTYSATYTLTQSDIDAGGISNSVLVEATDPTGTPTQDTSDNGVPSDGDDTPTFLSIPANPALDVQKTITSTTTSVGETVTFAITIENTGNVTLNSVAVASDTLTRADGAALTLTTGPDWQSADLGSGEGTLEVGETATYVASYVLEQSDLDAGGIVNVAVGQGAPPSGPPVTDTSDNGTPTDGSDDPTVLTIDPEPQITLAKEYIGADATFDAVGDVLDYRFVVTNVGNITLTDPILIVDQTITDAGGTITCPEVSPTAPFAPEDTRVCTASYTVTQDNLDAGEVLNDATATVGDAPPVDDSVTTPANQLPEMALEKVADSVDPATEFFVGAIIGYTYTVTNTGNITLENPITINDNLIPASNIACDPFPTEGIAPGGTYECRGTYEVTAGDVDFTSVTNSATATDGEVTSPLVTETIPNNAEPALDTVKSTLRVTDAGGADRASGTFEAVGDLIYYQFEVINSGTLPFVNDVVIDDARLGGPLVCFTPTGSDPDFRPGETAICETDASLAYAVTQADLDAGEVFNQALASTTVAGLTAPVISAPADNTTNAATDPELAFSKTVTPASYSVVGDVLTFELIAENVGNQTLTGVRVTDDMFPDLVCLADTLAPTETLTCQATLTVTQDMIDGGEVANIASVTGVSPNGTGLDPVVDDATATGPNSEPLSMALVKSANPTPFGPVGSSVTYRFAVENTSKFTLFDATVTDPLIPDLACVIPQIAPLSTDTSCVGAYAVTQQNVDDGFIENFASVTARDLNGNRTAQADATLVTEGPDRVPALEVTKLADVTSTAVNEIITYTLLVENTGNVSLRDLVIDDDMTRIGTGAPTFLTTPFAKGAGDINGDDILDVGETWSYSATYRITQSDLNAGGVSNTASVTGSGPDGTGDASDVSDNGNDGDGNTDDDPTVVEITRAPALNVVKTLVTGGTQAGETVVFEVVVRNVGNVDISDLAVSDTLTRNDGTDLGTLALTPVGAVPAPLSPTEFATYRAEYTLLPEDIDAGGISNVASATGTGPSGDTVTDVSDNGNDGDGNTRDDPTVLEIAPEPGLIVTKTSPNQSVVPTQAGDIVTFTITAENTGNVTLLAPVLSDTLTRADGTALTPTTITPEIAADIPFEGSVTYTVTYALTQADFDAGGIENTASVTATSPIGQPVTDVSDDGDQTDGNDADDPTVIAIPANTTMSVAKSATVPTRVSGTVFEVVFTLDVENLGNVTQSDIELRDDLTAFVAPASLVDVATPVVTGFETAAPNTGYNGTSKTNTLANGATILPGQTGQLVLTVQYDIAAGNPAGTNTVTLATDRLPNVLSDSVTVQSSEQDPDILASKTATTAGVVQRGSVVSYEITFENRNTTAESGLTFVDQLPVGMIYVDGSATFDGGDTPAPLVEGRTLRWSDLRLEPGQTVTIGLSARLVDGAGSFTNQAYVLNASGERVSNTATATVEVAPEPIFDCSDVIGKVFDDRDGDGYQDPPASLRGISDQDLFSDKLGKLAPAEIIEQGGEPGLAGVKLVTPRGDIITTDEFGRFSVPCAALPASIGSNFVLKLDERSLPTGYRTTTENPRVMRLTAGKMAEMNFGASIANAVEIDLTASAFANGAPSAALVSGLRGLVGQIAKDPSAIKLRYYRGSESAQDARARLMAVEKLIRDEWRGRGTYKLSIERTVRRLQ